MKLKLVCKCQNCGKLADVKAVVLTSEGFYSPFYEYKCYHCGVSGKVHMGETYWRELHETQN